jgi:hypothetical protein
MNLFIGPQDTYTIKVADTEITLKPLYADDYFMSVGLFRTIAKLFTTGQNMDKQDIEKTYDLLAKHIEKIDGVTEITRDIIKTMNPAAMTEIVMEIAKHTQLEGKDKSFRQGSDT